MNQEYLFSEEERYSAEVLGIRLTSETTGADVRKAARELSRKYHPDLVENTVENREKFTKVIEAKKALEGILTKLGRWKVTADEVRASFVDGEDPSVSATPEVPVDIMTVPEFTDPFEILARILNQSGTFEDLKNELANNQDSLVAILPEIADHVATLEEWHRNFSRIRESWSKDVEQQQVNIRWLSLSMIDKWPDIIKEKIQELVTQELLLALHNHQAHFGSLDQLVHFLEEFVGFQSVSFDGSTEKISGTELAASLEKIASVFEMKLDESSRKMQIGQASWEELVKEYTDKSGFDWVEVLAEGKYVDQSGQEKNLPHLPYNEKFLEKLADTIKLDLVRGILSELFRLHSFGSVMPEFVRFADQMQKVSLIELDCLFFVLSDTSFMVDNPDYDPKLGRRQRRETGRIVETTFKEYLFLDMFDQLWNEWDNVRGNWRTRKAGVQQVKRIIKHIQDNFGHVYQLPELTTTQTDMFNPSREAETVLDTRWKIILQYCVKLEAAYANENHENLSFGAEDVEAVIDWL